MKQHRLLTTVLAFLLLAALLTGCGKSQSTAVYAAKEFAAETAAPMATPAMGMDSASNTLADTGSTVPMTPPENRKWIVSIYISTETDNLDTLTASLNQEISSLGGYVEDQRIYNGSTNSSSSTRRYRNASFTVRIPADKADAFTQAVSGISNVISNEKSLEDVTLAYTTTENRLRALETEETRLLELLAKAENMSDLLEIESRLTDIRVELQNYGSQLRQYDNKIDYATIHLSVTEVQVYTPVEEPTVWERIRSGFSRSLKGVGENAVDFMVWVIADSPYLVVYGTAIALIVLLLKKDRKRRAARKAAKEANAPSPEKKSDSQN